MEQLTRKRKLMRRCSQSPQLWSTFWKVTMTHIKTQAEELNQHIITYADDIAILTGAARPPTAFKRMADILDTMIAWAGKYSLEFS